jgi:hypothetical protein
MDFGIVVIILVSLCLGYNDGIRNIKRARMGIDPPAKQYTNLFNFIFDK